MARLRLTPDFSRQRRELLASSHPPELEVPPTLEALVATLSCPRAMNTPGAGALWLDTVRSVSPLLARGFLLSGAVAATTAAATLVGMRILKFPPGLHQLLVLSVLFFLLNALSLVANLGLNRLRGWVNLSVETSLAARIAHKTVTAEARAIARLPKGNLKTLIASDARNVGMFFDNSVRNLIPAFCALAITAPLLIKFAGAAGGAGIFAMALLLPLSTGLSAISVRLRARAQARVDVLTGLVGEWVRNIRLIRYLSWQSSFSREVAASLRRYMAVSVGDHFLACLTFGMSVSWWMFAVATMVVWAKVHGAEIALPELFGSVWLITLLHSYVMHLPYTMNILGRAAPSMKRIADFLATPDQERAFVSGEARPPEGRPRHLHFMGVAFSYEPAMTAGAEEAPAPDGPGPPLRSWPREGRPVLRDLDFSIDLGARTAIIGEVGAGKSTLLRLLTGELPPTRGRIEVEFEDGERRNLWERPVHDAFRRRLALVPQQPFISNDTLGANLALGPMTAESERAVFDAAYAAELAADLEAFPGRYEEEIGENGVTLSGGQQQRVNLARAYASNRDYFVLDDTLSAVDARTEVRLVHRLLERPGGFLLVTHRVGELRRVDQILVLSQGRVVERGAPSELSAQPDSVYQRVLKAYRVEAKP